MCAAVVTSLETGGFRGIASVSLSLCRMMASLWSACLCALVSVRVDGVSMIRDWWVQGTTVSVRLSFYIMMASLWSAYLCARVSVRVDDISMVCMSVCPCLCTE